MKLLIRITACAAALFYLDCGKQNDSAPPPEPPKAVAPLPFTPPVDSTIALPRLQAWFSCNGKLDSLYFRFSDHLASTAPVLLDRYQKAFSAAQDSICVANGLSGGYKEYLWIMDNVGGVKNKVMFDSMKAAQPTASSQE